jgi:hypothetical protein
MHTVQSFELVNERLQTLGKRFIRNPIFDPQPLSNLE